MSECSEFYKFVISSLMGTLMGSGVTFLIAKMKAKTDRSQELLNLAIKSGVEAFRVDRENSMDTQLRNYPLSLYVYYHYKYFHLLDDGNINKATIKDLNEQHGEVYDEIKNGIWYKAINTRYVPPAESNLPLSR
jgi:hypothetical protein